MLPDGREWVELKPHDGKPNIIVTAIEGDHHKSVQPFLQNWKSIGNLPHALYLLCSSITRKNSRLVGVGTTCNHLYLSFYLKVCIHDLTSDKHNKLVRLVDKKKCVEYEQSWLPNHSRWSIFGQFLCRTQRDSGWCMDYYFYRFIDSANRMKFMQPKEPLLLGEPLRIWRLAWMFAICTN